MNYCVVTTVNKPSKAIEVLYDKFGNNLIVVGDEKTPVDWNYKDAKYILDLPSEQEWYEGYAPRNHYARKNLGYLEAIRRGAELIYDTDDDNIPNGNWGFRKYDLEINCESGYHGWFNVYAAMGKHCWPRGFSLKHINEKVLTFNAPRKSKSSIQQGLADGEPDVDAIWRLVAKNYKNSFEEHIIMRLQNKSWCPFNSQTTWFFPNAYPLMYLPVYATFRMTDIWRSFVAQRCIWELCEGVIFHSPAEVFQDRNEHDLLKDFEDEVPGYLNNDRIVEILSNLKLKQGQENTCENMLTCYQAIVDDGILPEMEIRSLKQWIKDYKNCSI